MMKNNLKRGLSSLFCAVEELKDAEWGKWDKSVSESVRLYLERGRLCLKNCMKKSRRLYISVEMKFVGVIGLGPRGNDLLT